MFIQQIISRRMEIKLLQKSKLLNLKVNLATKTKTHYETLGISPNATYNEIKAAYYDLTLKYHPDKNKSKSAKQIFYEISNAYDILSKYETRKHYDRTILVKKENTTLNKVNKPESIKTVYPKTGMRTVYNFDEWIQSHYTEAYKYNLSKKKEILKKQQEFQDFKNTKYYEVHVLVIILGGVTIVEIFNLIKDIISKD